jgi:MFS family permease
MMVMSLAPSLAPAIGAYLAEWSGWRADFVLLGTIGLAVLILTVSRLEETHVPAPVNFAGMVGSFLLLLRIPAFLSFAFATAFTSASWFISRSRTHLPPSSARPPRTHGLSDPLPMALRPRQAGVVRLGLLGSARPFISGRPPLPRGDAPAWCLAT